MTDVDGPCCVHDARSRKGTLSNQGKLNSISIPRCGVGGTFETSKLEDTIYGTLVIYGSHATTLRIKSDIGNGPARITFAATRDILRKDSICDHAKKPGYEALRYAMEQKRNSNFLFLVDR